MQYDPIKRTLGALFGRLPVMRQLFYNLLDLLLLRAWYIKREIKKWRKTAPRNAMILDAGAGFGQYSYFMHKLSKQWIIASIDLKAEQVDDCNRFFSQVGAASQVRFEVGDLLIFCNNNAYDLILSVDVMEHILEDTVVFQNFYHSLKDGGVLLISTPSDQGGSDAHDEHDASFIDEHVRNGYNKQDISDKLRNAGFSNIDVQYSYGKPGNLSWRLSMKYPITMLNKSKLFFIVLPVYYLVVYPLCFVLNYIDVTTTHQTGTGLIVKATKNILK